MSLQLDPAIFGEDVPKKNLCAVEGCSRPRHQRSKLCAGHYKRRQRGQPMEPPIASRQRGRSPCAVTLCGRPVQSRGLCKQHYARQLQGKPIDTAIQKYRRGVPTRNLGTRILKDTYVALKARGKDLGLPPAAMARRVLEDWARQFIEDRRSSESRVLSGVSR